MMSLILDIILAAIAVICIIGGIRRGFFKLVMSFVSAIASLLLAYAFTPVLSGYINEKFILPGLASGIGSTLASIAEDGVNSVGEAVFNIPLLCDSSQFWTLADRYGADREALSSLTEQIGVGTRDAVDKVARAVAEPIALTLSDVIAFIIIFVVSLIAFGIIVKIIGSLFKLPVLKGIDKTLGLVFGIISALVFVWIFAMLSSAVLEVLSSAYPSTFSTDIIEDSYLLRFFAKYNVIGLITEAIGY